MVCEGTISLLYIRTFSYLEDTENIGMVITEKYQIPTEKYRLDNFSKFTTKKEKKGFPAEHVEVHSPKITSRRGDDAVPRVVGVGSRQAARLLHPHLPIKL